MLCWRSKHIIIMVSSGLTGSMSQILWKAEIICGFHFDRVFKDTEINVNIVRKGLQYLNKNVPLQFSVNHLTLSANGTLLIFVLEL